MPHQFGLYHPPCYRRVKRVYGRLASFNRVMRKRHLGPERRPAITQFQLVAEFFRHMHSPQARAHYPLEIGLCSSSVTEAIKRAMERQTRGGNTAAMVAIWTIDERTGLVEWLRAFRWAISAMDE